MLYDTLVEFYKELESTTKRLEMIDILTKLFTQASSQEIDKIIYLTQGKLYPDFMGVEIGVADKLVIKSLVTISGKTKEEINKIADDHNF